MLTRMASTVMRIEAFRVYANVAYCAPIHHSGTLDGGMALGTRVMRGTRVTRGKRMDEPASRLLSMVAHLKPWTSVHAHRAHVKGFAMAIRPATPSVALLAHSCALSVLLLLVQKLAVPLRHGAKLLTKAIARSFYWTSDANS